MDELNSFYGGHFGDRWEQTLKPALLKDCPKIFLKSPFVGGEFELSAKPIEGAYALDRASVEPVLALSLTPEESLLDLCAAPGGKALVAIYKTRGFLKAHLNDSSAARCQRLKAVLFDHLPEELVHTLTITNKNGALFGKWHRKSFDKVLVDAPCSSERHHISDAKFKWSAKQSKHLAIRQHALLCAGFDALKPGGKLVYSTCSLSPFENDQVIKKLLKSRSDQFRVEISEGVGESAQFGRLILPDKYEGQGPIYYSVILKK